MADQFPHLPLPWIAQDRAKLRGGGGQPETERQNLANRTAHYASLRKGWGESTAAYNQYLEIRKERGYPEIDAGIPFLVKVEEDADLDFLRSAFQFEIVSQQEDGFVLVSSTDVTSLKLEEALDRFNKLERGGGTVARLYDIVADIELEERFQRVVDSSLRDKWSDLAASNSSLIVDISVECLGQLPTEPGPAPVRAADESAATFAKRQDKHNRQLHRFETKLRAFQAEWDSIRMRRENEIIKLVDGHGGHVLSLTDDPDLQLPDSFILRIRVTPAALRDIVVSYPFVFEATEPDTIEQDLLQNGPGTDWELLLTAPEPSAPAVCVIDSGIQENHRLLSPSIESAVSYCCLPGRPTDVADYVRAGGHGTRVAGRILFPDGVPGGGAYRLSTRIFNARVLDDVNQLPRELPPAKYLRPIVQRFAIGKGAALLFNHSVASTRWCSLKHMSFWAATLDSLSHDKKVLFIQAAGNIPISDLRRDISSQIPYPDFVLRPSHRVRNPAQSLHSLCVGSVSHAFFNEADERNPGGENLPSAFTASGYGIWQTIKPDVVDFGGDFAFSTDGRAITTPPALCPDMPRSTLNGGPAHDADAVGTSFAAPRVAALGSRIQSLIPEASAQLIRALIVHSAEWPESAKQWDDATKLRTMGFGIPNWSRATTNTEYRITFVTEDLRSIRAREAHVYQIPIPPGLRRAGLDDGIRVLVTLAFTASPRRTRRTYRFYNSVWLDWVASKKHETVASFKGRIFSGADHDGSKELKWFFGSKTNEGHMQDLRRQNGSLQKDWAEVKAHELPEDLCIAVRGHGGWDTNPEAVANYAIVVTIESIAQQLPIYTRIKQRAVRVQQRIQM